MKVLSKVRLSNVDLALAVTEYVARKFSLPAGTNMQVVLEYNHRTGHFAADVEYEPAAAPTPEGP